MPSDSPFYPPKCRERRNGRKKETKKKKRKRKKLWEKETVKTLHFLLGLIENFHDSEGKKERKKERKKEKRKRERKKEETKKKIKYILGWKRQ
jgi:hypothetical protein